MRRSFDKSAALISSILAVTGGIDPETGLQRKAPKQRYVEGDRFYLGLSYKRIKGKWSVKR